MAVALGSGGARDAPLPHGEHNSTEQAPVQRNSFSEDSTRSRNTADAAYHISVPHSATLYVKIPVRYQPNLPKEFIVPAPNPNNTHHKIIHGIIQVFIYRYHQGLICNQLSNLTSAPTHLDSFQYYIKFVL